jgi:hypothetical protein
MREGFEFIGKVAVAIIFFSAAILMLGVVLETLGIRHHCEPCRRPHCTHQIIANSVSGEIKEGQFSGERETDHRDILRRVMK